jgi:hypothetical protein
MRGRSGSDASGRRRASTAFAARACACTVDYCVSFARALAACGYLARVSACPQMGSQRQLCCRVSYIACPKNCTHCSKVMAQKLREWNCGQAAVHRVSRRCSAPSCPGGGDDRVSGTDAERDDDIYHNGTSGFGGNAARGEMADLSRVLINAQIAAS